GASPGTGTGTSTQGGAAATAAATSKTKTKKGFGSLGGGQQGSGLGGTPGAQVDPAAAAIGESLLVPQGPGQEGRLREIDVVVRWQEGDAVKEGTRTTFAFDTSGPGQVFPPKGEGPGRGGEHRRNPVQRDRADAEAAIRRAAPPGRRRRQFRRRPMSARASAGFTLIEVLAVLFLTALVLGVALDFFVDLSNQSAHAT